MNRDLTPRELDLLTVIAAHGCTVADAAERLGMSTQTAKNHLTNAYAALGVRSMVGAFVALGWLWPKP